jgi:lysophospholipase L1-like esterase
MARNIQVILIVVFTSLAAGQPAIPDSQNSVPPKLYILGDSTASNGADLGWGSHLGKYFDPARVTVVNCARGGRSSRTFQTEGLWDAVLAQLKPGDFILIQFGHNDGGAIDDPARSRGSLPGLGDETREIENPVTVKHETVRTYGWYMRKFIADARSKSAIPIFLSLTVRNIWTGGRVERGSGQFSVWTAQLAKAGAVPFLDLTNLIADQYEQLGQERVAGFFPRDHTHTNAEAANLNAAAVVSLLKVLPDCPLVAMLSEEARKLPTAPKEYAVSNAGSLPGGDAKPSKVAGLIIDGLVYPANLSTMDTPKAGILGLRAIDIPRYTQTGPLPDPAPERHWVLPPVPHNPNLPTIWTIGDSTVRCGVNATGEDQPGQWGWGTPFPGYFDPNKVNVVNRAVGGTTTASFYTSLWPGMADLIKKGDVVLIQFGTNSGRGELPGVDEETRESAGPDGQPATNHTFGWYMRRFIAESRAKGATPVVCSLIPRGLRNVNGAAVPQAVWARDVAAAEKADFIDLHELITRKYDAMEPNEVNALFCGSPHTSWAGAVLNAETVLSGLKGLKIDPVAAYYLPQVKEIPAISIGH